jgi:surface carbohydrate biosynthesis protein
MNILKMFNKKFIFLPYPKVDLIVLDTNNKKFNFDFLKYKVLYINEVNLYHLSFAFTKYLTGGFLKYRLSDLYFIEIVNQMKPKIGFGCDLDHRIYKFLRFFPKKKSILYQLGFYNFKFMNIMKENILSFYKSKKVKCDYFFICHSKFKKYFYYFNTKFVINGSLRSNEIKKNKKKNKYDILFISGFRKSVKSYYGTNLYYLAMTVKDAASSFILKILNNLQKRYNLKICIALSSNREDKSVKVSSFHENDFFKRDIKNYYTEKTGAYDLAEKSNLIVVSHSTLGQELLSRGHKVLFINPDFFFFNQDILNNLKKLIFITSSNEKIISSRILKLLNMSKKKWEKLNIKKSFEVPFDQGNNNLKSLIKKIIKI